MTSLRKTLLVTAALMAITSLGYFSQSSLRAEEMPPMASMTKSSADDKGKILYYRNPMGLQDTSPIPKKDVMGMDYVPVYENEAKEETGTVRMSPERIQKLGVRTEQVERRTLAQSVRAVGTIQIDETRQTVIAPRFDGWIEKLQADATGMQVKKGDTLFVFYSPDLTHIEARAWLEIWEKKRMPPNIR